MICKICNSKNKAIFKALIMDKYDIQYYYCENCGFLCTEEPYWLNEAYRESINLSDTGILLRNTSLSKAASVIIYFILNKKAKFLDYAGGYGIFTRLMRDIGFDFYWQDPYTKNIFARGFGKKEQEKYDLLTSFESFEHFIDPFSELKKMLKISSNIFFSTSLLPALIPKPSEWWYYGLDHGQHIAFYSKKTLRFMANKYNLNFYSLGSIHLFTTKKINPILYKLLLSASFYGLFEIVKKLMRSKTVDDMRYMKEKAPQE